MKPAKSKPAPETKEASRLGPRVIVLLAGVMAGVFLAKLTPNQPSQPATQGQQLALGTTPDITSTSEFKLGETNRLLYCQTCHLLPDPSLLDKVNWSMEVLPAMSDWLGIRDFPFEELNLDPRVVEANKLPREPILSLEEWRGICTYYIATAPNVVAPPTNRPPLKLGLKNFEVVVPPKFMSANTTLTKIDPLNHLIYMGSASNNSLVILDSQAQILKTYDTPSPPVDITVRKEGYYVTLIGSYTPSDKLEGKIGFLAAPGETQMQNSLILNDLPRPVNTHLVDLNGDGIEDILVCGYGNILGELVWYEGRPNGQPPVKHVIQDRPGAIKAEVYDFNRDGRPDILVMFAQAREGIEIMYNKGGGAFESQVIDARPPVWGYASFELVDANKDGFVDILACNGDNGDHVRHIPPFKPYHGIRLFLNDGKNNFKESWFHPMNGAYKTVTRDYDGDGDLDVAAISFYPDYRNHPQEGFIYLENKGGWNFDAFSFVESLRGRWLTMDAGDLDGDGDLDIVLGAFVDGPTYVPGKLQEKWHEVTPPVYILRNTTIRK